jgi:hypothetical protein
MEFRFDKTRPAQWPVIDNTASERQIAVAPLGLIAVQSWNLVVAQSRFWPSPSISVGGRRHKGAIAKFLKAT